MVKEIERIGLPAVHMCSILPISMTVGANRIVQTVGIPYPMGNPTLPLDEEKALRRKLLERGLKALATDVEGPTIL
jgi:betaine reductase